MSNSDGTAFIQLNRGYVAKIDVEDYERVSAFKWSVLETGNLCYARRTVRYGSKQKTILLHRFILGAEDGQLVDHINGDSLDCRKKNMRFVSKAQNNLNKKVRADSVLGIKGVRKHSMCDKYSVEIKPPNGKRIYIGLFETIEQAEAAYHDASVKYHGEYRRE